VHLEGRMHQVEGVEEEQWRIRFRDIVVADHLQCPCLEKLFLIARCEGARILQALRRHCDAITNTASVGIVVHEEVHEAVEAIVDLARRLEGQVLSSVVVGMLEVADP